MTLHSTGSCGWCKLGLTRYIDFAIASNRRLLLHAPYEYILAVGVIFKIDLRYLLLLYTNPYKSMGDRNYCVKSFGGHKDDFGANSNIELDFNNFASHLIESLVSKLSNSEISDFEHTETSSETDEDHIHHHN